VKTRSTDDGKVLVFPERHEYRAFKRWLLEFGNTADDYYDATAGCYVIRSASAGDLEDFGFKVQRLSRRQYARMVAEALAEGYHSEGE